MGKTFKATDESLNSYGFWVKTDGGDFSEFLKNPIALWNHHRSYRGTNDEVLPIGIWTNMKKEGTEVFFDFEPDMEDEFAAKIGRKVEKDHLKGCSIGIVVLTWSDDPKYLKPGQTRPTALKWKMKELSVCDIPSNNNSLSLYDKEGQLINLSEGEECLIPLLNSQNKMDELKQLGLSLGLGESVTLSQITTLYKKQESEINSLKAEITTLKTQEVERRKGELKTLLDSATTENRIDGTQRASWEKLFEADYDSAKNLLNSLAPKAKLADTVLETETKGEIKKHNGKTFSELRKTDSAVLAELKEKNLTLFNELYESEFGKKYDH